MEDYDQFVQLCVSQLRKTKEDHIRPPPPSSLIHFYGQTILPPLLSEEQREEMRRHRDAAQRAAVHMKLKEDSRLACVQTMLHSVQLRKTPTLEELLQESETNTTPSYSHYIIRGSVSQSNCIRGTKESPSPLPSPEGKEKEGVSLPPLTSTTYSAFFASDGTSHHSYQEGCLIDQGYSQQGSQPCSLNGVSHQSSGYVTYDNVENATSVSGGIAVGSESRDFDSLEGASNVGSFFLHNTSNTIVKMPDIISHPPIDGEELERSGVESSFSHDFLAVKDIFSSPKEESINGNNLPEEKFERTEEDLPVLALLDLHEDENLHRKSGPASSSENSGCTDNPDSLQTLSTHQSPRTEQDIQHDSTESEPADNHEDGEKPSEEPYRLSLQALLKKSQEYRRRQWMLRNQAKNTKFQERTQEQPRVRAEEQSLSDKENDEFPYKGTVTVEGKKAKDRRGTVISTVEISPKKSWDNEKVIEDNLFGNKANSKSTHLTGDGNTKDRISVDEETINNKLNFSQEVITDNKQSSVSPKHYTSSTENVPAREAVYTSPTALNQGVGKFQTIPAPNFCRSPVHCKSKGSTLERETIDGGEIAQRIVSVNTALDKDHQVEGVILGHHNIPTAVNSNAKLVVKGDGASVSARSSQHIDQLESNLSGLKELISDLESTLTERFMSRSPAESNKQSEDDDSREWQGGQSLDSFRNMYEETVPGPSIRDTEVEQGKGTEGVNLSELRLVKTLATERGKLKGVCKGGDCRKQQPPAKGIFSVTQQLRIPDMFRNVAPKVIPPRSVSVLSDNSNHPAERRNDTDVGGRDSIHSPSLNQSYDVEAPSGLWLHDGSGSDPGLFQEKHLTPESGGEGQGGQSKVKRRLLMHVTEEKRGRCPGASRKAGSGVRPNSSTPRAAVRQHEGHGSQKDREEQLKKAHAAQVRALQDDHRRQQEELLQALAARYHLLQSVSFPCSMSSSRPGDTLTFSSLSQPFSPLSEHYRTLLVAAVKGFLTRRLLRTDRLWQLVRTVRDTQQFLQTFQQQSPGRKELRSRQDLLLQERVTLQLRAARYEVHDIFFSLSARERMQLINWDRSMSRERELRRQSGDTRHPRGKSSLSAATQKSLERKRGIMIQRKAAEKHRGVVRRTGQNHGSPPEQPLEDKRGQFRANPRRVPKSSQSSRPR